MLSANNGNKLVANLCRLKPYSRPLWARYIFKDFGFFRAHSSQG